VEPAIEATDLTKSYGEVRVLGGVDIRVPAGTVFALLGPNGAGKTTTVRILTTLTAPDGGRARVAGHDIVRERGKVRRSISLTGQNAALDEIQTGAENLRMMSRLSGLSARAAAARADELLERFDLVDAGARRVSTYSGGMRRRLDLAASLITTPAVIFRDEPTTGLDPRSRARMWSVITELTRSGVTIFLTTQYLEEADRLADWIALVDNGRIVAEGTPSELKQRVSEQRLDLTLVDDTAFDAVTTCLGSRVLLTDRDRRTVSVATDGSAAHVRSVLDEVDAGRRAVERFALHSASLDDVFLALTGHATTQKEPARV
jgi:ABC-2 type transport system ATP-binding protein